MRAIAQPGPPRAGRIQSVAADGAHFACELPAGAKLLDAARQAFADRGFTSGTMSLSGGTLDPFAYVIPALSETPDHAAFYSQTFRPSGPSRIATGAMTFGMRDGAPFFHCHALWTEADGRQGCGHILPEETVIAAPIHVAAVGLHGAAFAAEPDPETNFKLFGPIRDGTGQGRFHAMRLLPNQDFAGALEQFCHDHAITTARLHGGVGSIIGARFDDGRVMEPFATEIAITSGVVASVAGAMQATLDIVLIDYTGAIAAGRLRRGDNPVFITVELVLEAGA